MELVKGSIAFSIRAISAIVSSMWTLAGVDDPYSILNGATLHQIGRINPVWQFFNEYTMASWIATIPENHDLWRLNDSVDRKPAVWKRGFEIIGYERLPLMGDKLSLINAYLPIERGRI